MTEETIILVGGPDTGKTNFLARLWESLRKRTGRLICPTPPDDIKYVEDALSHMLQGEFAPRSNTDISNGRSDVTIPIRHIQASNSPLSKIVVPDVTGELWKSAVETLEIPEIWMEDLRASSGAMIFVRVLSELNVAPLDWVTARRILRREIDLTAEQDQLPTQVMLCELLRFLEVSLKAHSDGSPPRVAVIVTAWDRLDRQTAASGPSAFLRREYPLLSGRLRDISKSNLDVRIYGLSVVGGDLGVDQAFRQKFLAGDLSTSGYVVVEDGLVIKNDPDITIPLAWLVGGIDCAV